jgi:hypothetical protein
MVAADAVSVEVAVNALGAALVVHVVVDAAAVCRHAKEHSTARASSNAGTQTHLQDTTDKQNAGCARLFAVGAPVLLGADVR